MVWYTKGMPIQQQMVIWFLVVLAVLSGIYSFTTGKMFPRQNGTSVVADQVSPYPTVAEVYVEPTIAPKEVNVAGAAFVAKEQACSYISKNIELKLYSKVGNVRIDAASKGQDPRHASIAITQSGVHIWDVTRKTGLVIVNDSSGLFAPDGLLDLISNQLGITTAELEETCRPQKVAETLFVPPAGIAFKSMDDSVSSLGTLLPNSGSLDSMLQQ